SHDGARADAGSYAAEASRMQGAARFFIRGSRALVTAWRRKRPSLRHDQRGTTSDRRIRDAERLGKKLRPATSMPRAVISISRSTKERSPQNALRKMSGRRPGV